MVSIVTRGPFHVFVRDRLTQQNLLASSDRHGSPGSGPSGLPSLSADGNLVAFQSLAADLVPGDNNLFSDIFVKNLATGAIERINMGVTGSESNGHSYHPSISADGRYVTFSSWANNLVLQDFNQQEDVFRYDRVTGDLIRVSISMTGSDGNGQSTLSAISADGRYVAFDSNSSNLVAGGIVQSNIYVRDCLLGTTEQVSVGMAGSLPDSHSFAPSLSDDGRYVAFSSNAANLVPGDMNQETDTFVYDRVLGVTQCVSVSSFGEIGDGRSERIRISGNGEIVVFQSVAGNLIQQNDPFESHVFARDLVAGTTERVSHSSGGVPGNNWSRRPAVSRDGLAVVFESRASELVPNDTNGFTDSFLHTRRNGLGSNSIWLHGPASAAPGSAVLLEWFQAPPNSNYWLAVSLDNSGNSIVGHPIDLNEPWIVLAQGVNSPQGSGSFTSPPVPNQASGLTLYLEVLAQDQLGMLYESNAHTLTVL